MELVRYDEMCRAIAAAHEVDEAKDIRDKALAIEVYSRQAHNIENEKRAIEIRIRAERRCGELLGDMEKLKGRPKKGSDATRLSDLGISEDQSSSWQKLAAVPTEEFEETFVGPDKPSTNGIIEKHRSRRAPYVKQRQVSVDVNDETWASFKEGAKAEGVSSAAKLGQLIEYHAPSRENEEADSWACIPNAMKEAQLNKRQQQSMKSVLKHFQDRRSQRLLILALEAEWPWMPQLS